MVIQKKLNHYFLIFIIFLLPFIDFLKNNINEIDIIIGKSFFFLILVLFLFLLLSVCAIKYFLKNASFYNIFLIIVVVYWLFFKHNFLKNSFNNFFNKLGLINFEYTSEISLLVILILSFCVTVLIYKNNFFLKKFIFIFFYLTFFMTLAQIIISNLKLNTNTTNSNEMNSINFVDKLNNEKKNIYFFILDGMQPIKEFEDYYKLSLKEFLKYTENENYKYIDNTVNFYDNTTQSLSSLFYLDKILNKEGELKNNKIVMYPTLLKKNNKSSLIRILNNLGYNFKMIGNFYAYCPKFNLKYCLNDNETKIVDYYLYINFFKQTPLIQITINLGSFFKFDYNKYFFYTLNDGIGRLINHLKKDSIVYKYNKPTFYFIHHMSPHRPYITNEDCSYKYYPGKINYEGYKAAYLCNLKKIEKTIKFLNIFDPDSIVVFQSDHNWEMSRGTEARKNIFNLLKIDDNCSIDHKVNLNNSNTLRLIFSCMTGNNPKFINN